MTMEKSINQFVWKYSARQQMLLVLITLAYFPTLYLLLELPKIIINQVIGGSATFEILDLSLEPEQALILLTLSVLVFYLLNALIKLTINIRKGVIAERLVRRLRYTLFDKMLRFPIQKFRVVSQGELISQINSETENLTAYISESVTLPLFQGGTMLTVLAFMFIQSPWLGLASVALIPIQILVIPRMQRRVNVLNHERVRRIRKFSEYIGETVSGAQAIRVHGIQRYSLAGYSRQLGKLFDVRLKLYRQKFYIKFINNFINQLTPILFYLIGGLLVIRGHLTVGALVAAIAGHKDMVAPWKELLKYYQMQQDAKIKYEQLTEQFLIADSDNSDYFASVPAREEIELFPLKLTNIVTEEDGKRVLAGFNLEVSSGEHVAIVDTESVVRSHIAEVILSLRNPVYGSAWLGSVQLRDVPGQVRSRRLAFQASSPPIFNVSVHENILLSIKQIPQHQLSGHEYNEALLAGNSEEMFDGEWVDYESYQFASEDELNDWYIRVMEATDADLSVIRNGLFQAVTEDQAPEQLRAQLRKIVEVRPLIDDALLENKITTQSIDEVEWCYGLSIAENLAFGKLTDSNTTPGDALYSKEVARILSYNGFDDIGEGIGRQIATMILRGLSSELSREQTMDSFKISSENVAEEIAVKARSVLRKPPSELAEQDRHFLLLLFLNLVLDDHPDIMLPGSVVSRIIFIRDEVDNVLNHRQRKQLQRFVYSEFHPGLTVLENLLFGFLQQDIASESMDKLLEIVNQVIKDADLTRDIMLLTLRGASAGISGSLLSATSRQSLPLARVLIKKPELIVVDEGLNAYEEAEQFRIKENIRKLLPETSIVWLTSKLDDSSQFDRVIDVRNAG